MRNLYKKRLWGFTLSEVLVTLGIIGTVAAISIPSLMAKMEKEQYVTGLKKGYTEFNHALIQMAADNGCVGDLQCTGLFDTDKTNQTLGTELVKYFKVVKNCESNQSGGPTITGCFSDKVSQAYDGSGTRITLDDLYRYRFITSDGMAFSIYNYRTNCGSDADNYSRHKTYNLTQQCGTIYIDVNGPVKGPNNIGRDIFLLRITNGKGPLLYPYGGADDKNNGPWQTDAGVPQKCYYIDATHKNEEGYYCAGRVIEEGWQMKY